MENSSIVQVKRVLNIYIYIEKLKLELYIDNINPKTTMSIYFNTLQINYYITSFLDKVNSIKKINIFLTPFDNHDIFNNSDLWLVLENINNKKDNIQQLVDLSFMNSKSSTLRLFDYKKEEYKEIIDSFVKRIKNVLNYLDNINDIWYIKNKYLETLNDNSEGLVGDLFIDKDNFAIYKVVEIDHDKSGVRIKIKIKTYLVDFNEKLENKEMFYFAGSVRTSTEKFLNRVIGEKYPEYFI